MKYPSIAEHHDKDDIIYLSGKDAGFMDVLVQTKHSQVKKMINDPECQQNAHKVFLKVWNVIKNTDVDALYAAGGQAWTNFMSDIVIFYVCRFHLFKKPMPMVRKCDIPKSIKTIHSHMGQVDMRD
jgi:hypothetical protein